MSYFDNYNNNHNVFFKLVLPIVRMTRNPDSNEIAMDTTVAVTCSIISYPGLSNIRWEQQISNVPTPLNGFTTTRNDTSKVFSVVTHSTIVVTGRDINGASSYCCAATNEIGTAVNCLDFGIAVCL